MESDSDGMAGGGESGTAWDMTAAKAVIGRENYDTWYGVGRGMAEAKDKGNGASYTR